MANGGKHLGKMGETCGTSPGCKIDSGKIAGGPDVVGKQKVGTHIKKFRHSKLTKRRLPASGDMETLTEKPFLHSTQLMVSNF